MSTPNWACWHLIILQEAVPVPEVWTVLHFHNPNPCQGGVFTVYKGSSIRLIPLLSFALTSIESTVPTPADLLESHSISSWNRSAWFSGPHHFSSACQGCVQSSGHASWKHKLSTAMWKSFLCNRFSWSFWSALDQADSVHLRRSV